MTYEEQVEQAMKATSLPADFQEFLLTHGKEAENKYAKPFVKYVNSVICEVLDKVMDQDITTLDVSIVSASAKAVVTLFEFQESIDKAGGALAFLALAAEYKQSRTKEGQDSGHGM